MAKSMDLVSWCTPMAKSMKDSGKMIKKQIQVLSYFQINVCTLENTRKANPMDREPIFGLQVNFIRDTGETDRGMGQVNGNLQMAATIKASGD